MSYVPDQGDIALIDCDPSAGMEIMKTRPVLVISKRIYSASTGFAVVVPIKSRPGGNPLELPVIDCKTHGSAQVHQFRSLDYKARNAKFIEKAPIDLVKEVARLIQLVTTVSE